MIFITDDILFLVANWRLVRTVKWYILSLFHPKSCLTNGDAYHLHLLVRQTIIQINEQNPHLVVSVCSWRVSALGGIVLAATQGHLTVGHRLGSCGWGTSWGPHLPVLYTWVTATVTIVVKALALPDENSCQLVLKRLWCIFTKFVESYKLLKKKKCRMKKIKRLHFRLPGDWKNSHSCTWVFSFCYKRHYLCGALLIWV